MIAITFLSYAGLGDGSGQMLNTPDQAMLTTGAILATIGAIIVMTVGLYLALRASRRFTRLLPVLQ